ncbi:MAG: hypothetical protein ACYDC3_17315 [Candidatus Binataceae bacterium]
MNDFDHLLAAPHLTGATPVGPNLDHEKLVGKDAGEKHGTGPGDETIRFDRCPEVEVVDAPIVQQSVTIEGIVYFLALVGTEVFSPFGLFLDYSQPLLESGRANQLARSFDDAGPRFDAAKGGIEISY